MPNNRELPGFDQVDAALVRQRLGVDAPELHGLMSGYLAAGGTLNEDGWLAQLHVDADAGGSIEPLLQTLLQVTRFALEDPDLGFELLLPDDEAALAERIDHLFLWCQGFVAGFALVPAAPSLGEDAREALEDISRIAAFRVSDEDQDEQAFMEIAEFVRVAVLLIHGDTRPPRDGNTRLH